MDKHKLLIKEVKKRFKANAVVEQLEAEISGLAKESVYEKYKAVRLFRGEFGEEIEYNLEGVKARLDTSDLYIGKVEVYLYYFACSTLTKAKRDRVTEAISCFKRGDYLDNSNHKIPLWLSHEYKLNIEEVLSGKFTLGVE